MKDVILTVKQSIFLIGPVYREMQAREQACQGDEDEEIHWANNYPLYKQVITDMIESSPDVFSWRELEYRYGDMQGKPLKRHPFIADIDAMAQIEAHWKSGKDMYRNMQPSVLADTLYLNYDQVISLLNQRNLERTGYIGTYGKI